MPRHTLPNHCERCGDKTIITTGSYFDEAVTCMRCNDLERAHPDFERARDTEVQQVQAGNYNYEGIGLPAGLLEQCQQARRDTQTEPSTKQAPLATN